jgi:hypothetical protein
MRVKARSLARGAMCAFAAAIGSIVIATTVTGAETCGEWDPSVQGGCREVRYAQLPAKLRTFMAARKCDVTTGSNYDYGYAIDLDADGRPEYAFCCGASPHGPCRMSIFGKRAGRWRALLEDMSGYSDGSTPCLGFVVLSSRHAGYHDICQDGTTLAMRRGKYRPR